MDEETGGEGFTGLYTENEFWVLGAKGSYSKRRIYGQCFKKGKPKGHGKKGGKRSRPGFRPRPKGKGYAAWEDDRQDTAFWGKGKGKGKKGKKGMKGKDSFKGMPSWKGKGKGDGKSKGGKPFQQQQPPQANIAQTASSSASQAPEKQETAHAEGSLSYDYDTYWTDDWSGYESYYGYDGDYSQGDWYNWSYFASAEELTESEHKHLASSDVISEDGQTDQINRFCFSAICLFRFLGHELVEAFAFVLLFVSLMEQCLADLNRSLFKSIRHVEDSVSTESGDLHSFRQHTCPLNSVTTEGCVFLNYDHGAQQALLCEYVDLGSHPTYAILDSGCTRAMGSRFAIERLVQACQQHPKRDHIWFSK